MINPVFSMSPAARRAICEQAMARYVPRAVEADTRIGEVVQVPHFTRATIVARVTKFNKDWYVLEATLISRMTLHKLVEAI